MKISIGPPIGSPYAIYFPSVFSMILAISALALSASAFTFSPRMEETMSFTDRVSNLGDGYDRRVPLSAGDVQALDAGLDPILVLLLSQKFRVLPGKGPDTGSAFEVHLENVFLARSPLYKEVGGLFLFQALEATAMDQTSMVGFASVRSGRKEGVANLSDHLGLGGVLEIEDAIPERPCTWLPCPGRRERHIRTSDSSPHREDRSYAGAGRRNQTPGSPRGSSSAGFRSFVSQLPPMLKR